MRRTRVLASVATLTLALLATAVWGATAVEPSQDWDQVLTGTAGKDDLSGGNGRDKLVGLGNDDRLSGGRGSDWLQGGPGDDDLFAGAKHDELYGGEGEDRLVGSDGQDRLIGGGGRDRLLGGPGDDVIIADGDSSSDSVSCGEGTDDRATVDAKDVVTGCETVTVTGQ